MDFKHLGFNKPILKAINDKQYTTPTPVQEKCIPLVLDKNDLIVASQTGTGKTAAFALPIVQLLFDKQDAPKKGRKIKALIISPTRELAVQIEENFYDYSKYTKLETTVLYGGAGLEPQIARLRKGVDILVATPGRLLDLHKRDVVNLDYVETFVLDEADLMLDMGFINDVKKIERLCPKSKQTLLFSATMPAKIAELAESILVDPRKVEVTPHSSAAETVTQRIYRVSKADKVELCFYLLRNVVKGNIIIFRRTKYGVSKLEKSLKRNGFLADCLHGDKSQNARQRALNKFKNGDVNILVATDVAARGIDIDDLDAVINFDIPNVSETYVHRIGRTGRAGKEGISISMCSAEEREYLKGVEKLLGRVIEVEEENPFPQAADAEPEVHTSNRTSKYKRGRKSSASKKKKKRWY